MAKSFGGQGKVTEQRSEVVSCDGAECCSVPQVEVLHAEVAGDVMVREQVDTALSFRVANSLRKNWSTALVRHETDAVREPLHARPGHVGGLPTSADPCARRAIRPSSSRQIRALRTNVLARVRVKPTCGRSDPAEGREGVPGEVADDGLVEFAACEPAHVVDLVAVG